MISTFVDEYMKLTNISDQGHPLTFVQDLSDSTFSNFFSLETATPIEVCEAFMGWGMKVSTNGSCHMTKMAAMPIYGRNI